MLDEVLAHRTTLVFVNSRGLAERFTAQLNDLYLERQGKSPDLSNEPAHYGSLIGSTTKLVGPVAPQDAIATHRTTLVFVNSRGLAERFTAQLNDLYLERQGKSPDLSNEPAHYGSLIGSTTKLVGPVAPQDAIAMAHHGSVSKDRRKQIEEQLKAGKLKCVVATSSLELGIDMGSVDLVIQLAPPLSVSSGLQRVGRADHRVGGVSHALIYPVTREQIIGAAASVESMLAAACSAWDEPTTAWAGCRMHSSTR